ncbi:cellulose synthase-like protein E6 [Salvia miltiorrhiza]|uniref:cellulose synthase-like protein E6 n=1 Tax=Salvia miltiorrhiza TaxID=226208 RepID=UPI0025ACA0C0|nr:cellulose synthase-like protein E6 [Salvia miltiorrhiza]
MIKISLKKYAYHHLMSCQSLSEQKDTGDKLANLVAPKHSEMENKDYVALFESKAAKGRVVYWVYAVSMAVGISVICIHRVMHFPQEKGVRRWAWTAIFMAELWFIIYWLITQFVRYRAVFRYTFKDRLSRRYSEDGLPAVDIFVSTADPQLEPPLMVADTVLSVMAYDYPPDKLNVYLSDDGCSDLVLYALFEASNFSRLWLPFCRSFHLHLRAPKAYFSTVKQLPTHHHPAFAIQWTKLKKLYNEMEARINEIVEQGRVPEHHKGVGEWEFGASRSDHHTILQVLIDSNQVDIEGKALPRLVYLAREKRPGYPHNFKAGAMNALIRVSSRISNAPIILNIDCDHYSNNSQSVRDALCFFMDEEQGHNVGFVQFPQCYDNITKNDLYGNSLRVPRELELAALDAHGGPLYIGSCCFHRRDALAGNKYEKGSHINWKQVNEMHQPERPNLLQETATFANCRYEENSSWGKEMGFKYGCPVEDVVTGLSIKCKGWRSIFFNPERKGFLGVAPATLLSTLIQHTRWSEGHFQIFLSKYCSLIYGLGKIPLQLQISYLCYNLWAANCLATLYYVTVPTFCLLKGINLFPQLSSNWILPYAYVLVAKYSYSLGEFLCFGGTLKGWYNDQRMWLYKRVTCYLFGFCQTILRSLGFAKLNFAITGKNESDDVSKRFEQEIMEFGAASSMFIILATIALFNLLASISIARSIFVNKAAADLDCYALQIVLNGVVIIINLPLFEAIFLRRDEGRMPASVTYQSFILAGLAYMLTMY